MENFNKVLNSSDNRSEKILAYRFRGKLYCAKRDYEKAIEDMSKIIEIEPNSYTSYVERGETFYKQQQYDRAIKDYTRAIELIEKQAKNKQKEELTNILIKRGNAYRFNNQLEEAIADFSRAIELCPDDIRAYESRAMLFSKLGQKEKAIDDYRKVLEIDPKQFIAVYNLKSLLKNEKGASEYLTL
jgi:tetratricopeptide (TPR) repeat protein